MKRKLNIAKILSPDIDSNSFKMLIGRKMKILRKSAGLKQKDVQEYLEYDSSGMMTQIEKGRSGVSLERIYRAAKLFGVHPFVLLSDDDLDDERLEMYLNLSKMLKQKEKNEYFDTIKKLLETAIK